MDAHMATSTDLANMEQGVTEATVCDQTTSIDPCQQLQWQIQYGNLEEDQDMDVSFLRDIEDTDEIVKLTILALEYKKYGIFETLVPYVKDSTHGMKANQNGKTILDKLLCSTVESGESRPARALIQAGANIDAHFCGKPLVHIAALLAQLEVLDELVKGGASLCTLDKRGNHILHSVLTGSPFQANKIEVVRRLKQYGMDTQVHSSTGKHDLHLAANCSPCVLDMLLEDGCDVNMADDVSDDTALHIACNMACQESIEILLKHGCKLNIVNKYGETPLGRLLRLNNDVKDFHTKTRVELARKLIAVGFRMLPLASGTNQRKPTKGRDKGYDKYMALCRQLGGVSSLQSIARVATTDSLASGVDVKKQMDSLDIPVQLKSYILFSQDKTVL